MVDPRAVTGAAGGDGIGVFPEPDVDEAGVTSFTFFVSGLGDRMRQDPRVEPALVRLIVRNRLRLLDERATAEDTRALLVVERTGVALAWVPGLLLSHLDTIRSHGEPELSVVDTNGPDVPPAYRLLVMLRGTAPVGYWPFDGPCRRSSGRLTLRPVDNAPPSLRERPVRATLAANLARAPQSPRQGPSTTADRRSAMFAS